MKLQVNSISNHLIFIACAMAAGLAAAQNANLWPKPEDPLHARIDAFENLIRTNHLNEGNVLPRVILPPAGQQAPIAGMHENACAATGQYLAALAFKYAVTSDLQVRQLANQVWEGVLKLEQVTGEPGCIAQSFEKTDAPAWQGKTPSATQAWHTSTAMPGYRWFAQLSAEQLSWLIFGLYNYWDLCADDAHREAVAGLVDRIISRCIENNFRIVDPDGKMTLRGNYCPDLPHENRNALLIVSHLRTAVRMTDSQAFQAAYQRLITKYHYDDQAILAKSPDEVNSKAPDDGPAAAALYTLMRIEKDEPLLQKYRMCINRYWAAWKDSADPLYPMLYQVLTEQPVVTEAVEGKIKAMRGGAQNKRSWSISNGPQQQQIEVEEEEVPVNLLVAYWFGRHHGLIDPAW